MGALSQWAEIEAGMMTHYNLSATDIFEMSWRRFVVLFSGIFNWSGPDGEDADTTVPAEHRSSYENAVHEARGASGEVARSFDWDAAMGRTPADSREILSVSEFKGRMGQDG